MPPPHKGKAPTKGAKQIITENAVTVSFYRNMSIGAGLFYNLYAMLLNYESVDYSKIFMNIIVTCIYIACYQTMLYISRARYGEQNQIIDPGLDLNMEGGMGEHIKDIVILSSITHVLSALSEYFWFLLLLLPIRVFWLVWVNFLGPWFFQEAPQDTEQDEKKRKKMERKMKRFHSITHVLSALSEYFWFLLLLLPIRVFWLVWVNFLGPWFFQEAPQDTEQDEKKRKKMERKMKR